MTSHQPLSRQMTEDDLDAVLSIQAVCYSEVAPESRESFLSKLRHSPTTCMVAEHSGTIVGYLVALPIVFTNPPALNSERFTLSPSPDTLYLHDLAVDPRHHRSGIGKLLIEAFFEHATRLKVKYMSLIAVQNSSAFWGRFGFAQTPLSSDLIEKISGYGPTAMYMSRRTRF